MLARLCSKSIKLDFSNMWTESFDVQAGFRKGRGTRDQIANIYWIIEKAREFQENKQNKTKKHTSISALLTMPKPLTVWITINCGKFLKRWEYQTTLPASWATCMQVKKQQLEMDMEKQTGSKFGKEYIKAVYCHPSYLTYRVQFSSVAQSCPTLCDPMNLSMPGLPVHQQLPEFTQTHVSWHHELASSQWCHPAISSSVVPYSSCPQSLPASGSFPMSQLFTGGGRSIGVSASASVLPMNTQDWSPLGWTGWISLQSKGLSRVFPNTTVQKHQFFGAQPSSQSNSHIHTWPQEKP